MAGRLVQLEQMVQLFGVVDLAAHKRAATQPSTITEMRSQSSINSTRSDDTTSTAVPSRAACRITP
ncbi:hypothetical protein [Bradyrhizobium septentrionale]|uniref:Uncharacterized protein n=1 Tax=Bradyrhizobium septentrionale TaxID=1404411 RepID=A0ABZ2NR96_9BRAD